MRERRHEVRRETWTELDPGKVLDHGDKVGFSPNTVESVRSI